MTKKNFSEIVTIQADRPDAFQAADVDAVTAMTAKSVAVVVTVGE